MPLINAIGVQNSAWWLSAKADVSARAWSKVATACNQRAATFFHQHQLRRRFVPGNHSHFHLPARQPKYIAEKIARARRGEVLLGGVVDLVKFGELRDRLQAFGAVSATAKQGILQMVGPWYTRVQQRRKDGGGSIDKALEILQLIEEERQEIQTEQQATLREKMTENTTVEHETI